MATNFTVFYKGKEYPAIRVLSGAEIRVPVSFAGFFDSRHEQWLGTDGIIYIY